MKFANVDDCCAAMLRIGSDAQANGKSFYQSYWVYKWTMNYGFEAYGIQPQGRCLGVVPREEASCGYKDLEHDDYKEGDFLRDWEDIVLDTAQVIVDMA